MNAVVAMLGPIIPQLKEQALVYAVVIISCGSIQVYNEQTYARISSLEMLAVKMDGNYLEKSIEDNQRELWALMDKKSETGLTRNELERQRMLTLLVDRQMHQLNGIISKINENGGRYDF